MEQVHTLLRSGNQKIKLGYIAYTYNAIDTNALLDGRLVMGEEDGLLRDGAGMPSPYNEFSLAAPVIFTEKLGAGIHTFYYDPALALDNTPDGEAPAIRIALGAEELELKPGESGELSIPSFGDDNEKITVKASIRVGGKWLSYYYAFTDISALAKNFSQTTEECVSGIIPVISGAVLTFQGYDESTATQGVGEYKIFYHLQSLHGGPCDPYIRKPLILLDGFDPGDERGITPYPNKSDGIWDLLSYGSNDHLGDELRLMGYDVIILNFPTYNVPVTGTPNRDGGADYIERNAMVLVKLIQEVKAQLAANGSTEKIVVVGPSMGGQISRYALARMEQKYAQTADPQWQHNTRLWLSFDSPHLGANIPISVQQSLVYLGYHLGKQDAADKYQTQLRSKAARQLLIEQMDGLNGSASFHQTYYTNLQANGLIGSSGWPQNLRRIALTNGTNTGIKTGTASAEAIHVKGEGPLGIKVFEMKLRNIPANGSSGITFEGMGADIGSAQFGAGSISQTSTTVQVVANMSLKQTVKIGWIGMLPFYKKVTTTESEYTTANNNTLGSLDVVQGGTYDSYAAVADEVANTLNNTSGVNNVTNSKNQATHCFIPTLSALGSMNINYDWGVFFNKEYALCAGATPFQDFYIPGTNEEHVSLTQSSADWVKYEIEEKRYFQMRL